MNIKILFLPGKALVHEVPDGSRVIDIWPLLETLAHEQEPGRIFHVSSANGFRNSLQEDGYVALISRPHSSGPWPPMANHALQTGLFIEPKHNDESARCQCRSCERFRYYPTPKSIDIVIKYGNGPVHHCRYHYGFTLADMQQTFEDYQSEADATGPHVLFVNEQQTNDMNYVMQSGDRIEFIAQPKDEI